MKAIIKLSIITFLASWLGQSCNSNPSDLPEFVTFSEVTASAIALDSFYTQGIASVDLNNDFYPELYTGSDEMGKVCSMAGYGHHGTFKTGWKPFDNKRRAGSNIVADMYKECLLVKSDDAHTTLEFLIAPGDSGGGMFIDQKLAGINSFIMATDGKGDSDYGDDACFTRISKYIPWIKSVKEQIEIIDKLTPEQIATIQKIQKERVKSEKKK